MRKHLSLRRETLSELSTAELGRVNGGQQLLTHITCDPTDDCTHGPSFDEKCPTFPINPCLTLDTCIVTA